MTRPVAGVATWRWLLLVIGVVALVLAFATKSSSKTQPVATVDGQEISLQTFDHWLKSSAIAAHSSSSSIPNFVPDAPGYVKCIQYIHQAAVKAKKTVSDTTALSDCHQLREALAEEVMQLLISSYWILHEGQLEGVSVTQAQIDDAVHKSLPKTGLVSYLKGNGLSREDLAFEAKVSLIAQKLSSRHAGATPTITAAQIQQFYNANKSSLGSETLAQATPAIKQELIAEAQAPAVEKYLTTVQQRFQPRTTCARGYRVAYYCKKT